MMRPLLASLLILATACSTRTVKLSREPVARPFTAQDRQQFQRVPIWYLNPPADSANLVASATALSADMALALERAELDGRNQLAAKLDEKFGGIARRMQREVAEADSGAVAEEFTRLYRLVTSQWVRGGRATQRHVEPEGNGFRAWVLLQVPIADVHRELVRVARTNERVAAQIVSSAAFRALELELERTRPR